MDSTSESPNWVIFVENLQDMIITQSFTTQIEELMMSLDM